MEGYVWYIIGFLTVAVYTFIRNMVIAKYGIKDKDSDKINAIEKNCAMKYKDSIERIEKLEKDASRNDKGMSVMLQTQKAMLVTLKKGSANGEIDKALKLFDATFEQEYSIK